MSIRVFFPTELALRGPGGVGFKAGLWTVTLPPSFAGELSGSVLYCNLYSLVTLTYKNTRYFGNFWELLSKVLHLQHLKSQRCQ